MRRACQAFDRGALEACLQLLMPRPQFAEALLRRVLQQPCVQLLVACAALVQHALRRAARQPRAPLREAPAGALQPGQRRTPEPLREVIETLHLLMQPHAGMRELQAPLDRLEARAADTQLAAHAAPPGAPPCARAPRRQAAPSGTTSSAAAEGVGARASATKSAMVKSISWPTPVTTGSAQRMDGARHALIVERPQVLQRATAAREDQHVALGARRRALQRRDERRHGCGALHRRRVDEHRRGRIAPRENVQDVAQRRA